MLCTHSLPKTATQNIVYQVINKFFQTRSLNFSKGKKDRGKVRFGKQGRNTHTMLKPLGNPGFKDKFTEELNITFWTTEI